MMLPTKQNDTWQRLSSHDFNCFFQQNHTELSSEHRLAKHLKHVYETTFDKVFTLTAE